MVSVEKKDTVVSMAKCPKEETEDENENEENNNDTLGLV